MIGRVINGVIWLIGAGVVSYFVFFVPVGERTVYQHATRIWATPEAQDLQREVKEATIRGVSHLEHASKETAQAATDASP